MSQYTLVDPLTELLDANPADLVAVSVVPTTLHKALCDIIRHVRQHDEQIASMKSQSHAIRDTMKSQSDGYKRAQVQHETLFEAMKTINVNMTVLTETMAMKQDIADLSSELKVTTFQANKRYEQLDREKLSLHSPELESYLAHSLQNAIQSNNTTQSTAFKERFEDQARAGRQQFAKWRSDIDEVNAGTMRRVRQELDGGEEKMKGYVDDIIQRVGDINTFVKTVTARLGQLEDQVARLNCSMTQDIAVLQDTTFEVRALMGLLPPSVAFDPARTLESCTKVMVSPLFTTLSTQSSAMVRAAVDHVRADILADVDTAMRLMSQSLGAPIGEQDITVLVANELREFREVVDRVVKDSLTGYSQEFITRHEAYEHLKKKADVLGPGDKDQEKAKMDLKLQSAFKFMNERVDEISKQLKEQGYAAEGLKKEMTLLGRAAFGTASNARYGQAPTPPANMSTAVSAGQTAGRGHMAHSHMAHIPQPPQSIHQRLEQEQQQAGGYLSAWVKSVDLRANPAHAKQPSVHAELRIGPKPS